MLEVLRGVTLIAATLTMGLAAGLFYAFAVAVMPGLGQSSDRTFVETMQRINVAIVNGWFLVVFFGPLVLPLAAAALHLPVGGRAALPWIAAAFLLYGATIVITIARNIPMNNALDAAGPVDRIADPGEVRARFEGSWVRWNVVRAITSTAAFGCLIWALVLYGRIAAGA
ncbi:anthrone oxygenase family protein [Allosalinactinospora lopnorensis]|uniref:anthrone oxygenase family protein n=1 Tax=Allosalinactinospora lopnorensis TaxID=1352348 RepID=UPI000623DF6D|nr:anthrone oxygenase family protein [Allosalinactinospora lopnorensis]